MKKIILERVTGGALAGLLVTAVLYKTLVSPATVLDAGQFLLALYIGLLAVFAWHWRHSPRRDVLAWLILIFAAAAAREGIQELVGTLYAWPAWAVNLAASLRVVKCLGVLGVIRQLTYRSKWGEWTWIGFAAIATLFMVAI